MSSGPSVDAADVLVRCDVGPTLGVGHLMRCVALAEELLGRGLSVVFSGEVSSVPFAVEQLGARGLPFVPAVQTAEEHVRLVRALRPRLVVVDSYVLQPEVYAALRAEGPRLLALVDGPPGGRVADLYLDQNIGSEEDLHELPRGAVRLAGLRYALMRNDLLTARPDVPRRGGEADPLRVFAFFGGTDAFGAAPAALGVLARTGADFAATVVAGTGETRARLLEVPLAGGQVLDVIGPTDRLANLVTSADVVLSAAGTSTWELACLGAASGLVCVADNQVVGFHRMIEAGGALGIGSLSQVAEGHPEAVGAAARLLGDEGLRERLRRQAWHLVDGRGRARVADVALAEGAP